MPATERVLDGGNYRHEHLSNLCEKLGNITLHFCEQHEAILSVLKRIAAEDKKEPCTLKGSASATTQADREVTSASMFRFARIREEEKVENHPVFIQEGNAPLSPQAKKTADRTASNDDMPHLHIKDHDLVECAKGKGAADARAGGQETFFQAATSVMTEESIDASALTVSRADTKCSPDRGKLGRSKAVEFLHSPELHFELRPVWHTNIDLARLMGRKSSQRACPALSNRAMSVIDGEAWQRDVRYKVPLRPDSPIRICWDMLVMCGLFWDLFVTPMLIGFDLQEKDLEEYIALAIRIAWSIDVVLCFCTGSYDEYGKLVMEARKIITDYTRTWFILDFLVASVDWFCYLLFIVFAEVEGNVTFSLVTIIRMSRVVRTLRILSRLWRITSTAFLPRVLYEVFLLDRSTTNAIGGVVQVVAVFLICFHYFACIRFAISSIGDSLEEGASLSEKYLISMQLSLQNLYGLEERTVNRLEGCFSIAIVLLTFLLVNVFVAKVTCAFQALQNSMLVHEQTACNRFLKRRQISVDNSVRMKTVIRSRHTTSARAVLEEEKSLLECLPSELQYDLHAEMRRPLLRLHMFFTFLDDTNMRLTRQLAHEAIEEIEVLPKESIFQPGDACRRALLVTRGNMEYHRELARAHPNKYPESEEEEEEEEVPVEQVLTGQLISEIVLWSDWEHCGTLTASVESIIFGINYEIFGHVVRQHLTAIIHAVKYGKRFLYLVNNTENNRSDVFKYNFSATDLDHRVSSTFDHFVFLSHHKEMAGTEATLLREELTQLVQADTFHPANDLVTPVFVDSEDLFDLSDLTAHVANSECLVFLLTTGILTRPWCLLELVTAYRENVQIVPVEVQSRRLHYTYPDEAFYHDLLTGDQFSDSDKKLLRNAGITLEECVTAIRYTFTKIACPFSPHKSRVVRRAEMLDIVERIRNPQTDDVANRSMRLSDSGRSDSSVTPVRVEQTACRLSV
eukprot:TRINITY_DN4945_c0_g1_i1.p1 TRINITY_DN4945_c0_g1~~TRINITY_DN4945_c0_g1_i1.p1  ORF type:complete len:968 (+),score=139.94 TRINITY_DN4945_c0_g1_i1:78-2981(+)